MKVKVLKKFRDKYTKRIHKVNDVLEVTEERYKEILQKGKLVEPVAEKTEEVPTEETASDAVAPAKKKTTKKK